MFTGPQFNNHTLLAFNHSKVDLEALCVTEATLWIFVHKANMYHDHEHRGIDGLRQPTAMLWLFRVPQDPPTTVVSYLFMVSYFIYRLNVY